MPRPHKAPRLSQKAAAASQVAAVESDKALAASATGPLGNWGFPLCTLTLPGLSSPRCIKWSSEGQACVVTDSCLYILTPAPGYHPLLKPTRSAQVVQSDSLLYDAPSVRPPSASRSTDSSTAVIEFFECAIDIDSATSREVDEVVSRVSDEDYNTTHPGQTLKRFKSVDWTPNGSALAFIDSDLSVRILEAPQNIICGPWTVERVVQCDRVEPVGLRSPRPFSSQMTCLAWSPGGHLTIGTRSGQILLDTRDKAVEVATLGSEPVTSLSWSHSRVFSGGRYPKIKFDMILLAVQPSAITILYTVAVEAGNQFRTLLTHSIEVPSNLQVPLAQFVEGGDDRIPPELVLLTSPGAVHTWQFASDRSNTGEEHWRTCQLLPEQDPTITQATRDPHAEAIALDRLEDGLYLLTLGSGLQYRVPLPLPDKIKPHSLVSTIPDSNSHLASLRKRIEAHHRVDAWAQDGCSGLIAVMQTAGDVSSFRSHADRNSQVTLMLPAPSRMDALKMAEMLVLSALSDSTLTMKRPHHFFRPLIALHHAVAPSRKWDMLSAIRDHVHGIEIDRTVMGMKQLQDRQPEFRRRFYLLDWLLRESRCAEAPNGYSFGDTKQLRTIEEHAILSYWLLSQRKVINEVDLSDPEGNEGNRLHFCRIEAAAARVYQYMDYGGNLRSLLQRSFNVERMLKTQLVNENETLRESDLGIASYNRSQELDDREDCRICAERLHNPKHTIKVEYPRYSFWPQRAVCERGHVSARCSQTFATTWSAGVRTCSSCGLKAQDLTSRVCSSEKGVLTAGLSGCTFCEGGWVVIS